MSKGAALLTALIAIFIFGIASIVFPERMAHLGTVLTAIVTLTGAYIGAQVINNGVRGKFFNTELYNAENRPGTEGVKNDGEK